MLLLMTNWVHKSKATRLISTNVHYCCCSVAIISSSTILLPKHLREYLFLFDFDSLPGLIPIVFS